MSYWGSNQSRQQQPRRSLSPVRGRRGRDGGGSGGNTAEKFVNPTESRHGSVGYSYPGGINPPKPQLIGATTNSSYQNAPPLFPSYSKEPKQNSSSEPQNEVLVAEQLFPPGKTSDLQIRLNKTPNQLYIGKIGSEFGIFVKFLVYFSIVSSTF